MLTQRELKMVKEKIDEIESQAFVYRWRTMGKVGLSVTVCFLTFPFVLLFAPFGWIILRIGRWLVEAERNKIELYKSEGRS